MTAISVPVAEAARLAGVSSDTIRAAINLMDLPAKRVGRRILVRVVDLEAWIDGLDDARDAS